ncbi:restriction endonuclease subunit S, partial [Bacteroides acidifaciens]
TDDKKLLSNTIILIKSKIIDLAMQGKLVPQDPADEPAADMLRRVNPKAKIITDNPQCRNLPLGWTLCQLRDLCSFLSRGKSPKYSETPNQYPVFAQKCNLKDGDISLTQARFLDENTISKWPEKYRLRDGDVLVNSTGTGTVGRTRMFKSEYLGNYPFVVPDSHVSVVRSFDEIDSTYIFYCLYCQDGQQYFAENLAGSTNQKELYIDVIGDKSIMLPPINEQKRIVAKIEEQYSVLYEIEASLRS